jgi:hypothetical protein
MSAFASFADSSRIYPDVREVPKEAVSNRNKKVSLLGDSIGKSQRRRLTARQNV